MAGESGSVVEKLKPKPRTFEYKNVSGRNIFTEQGRCMAGETVKLLSTDAKTYGDKLEKC